MEGTLGLRGYLGLGSNVGDSLANLRAAADRLPVVARSSVYLTEPQGEVLDQPDFLNAAVEIETSLSPERLLQHVKEIEAELGRDFAQIRHGPRVVDIDLLLLGGISLHSIDVVQNDASIGYWTAPAARGRGVAALAVDAACRWAFLDLPVDRIELCHAVENTASGRVAEKAGFTYEGHLRRSFRYGDGRKHDELLWARLADDEVPGLSTRS